MRRKIAAMLKERGAEAGKPSATLAVAESCTGGRLAEAFTAASGASEYFLGGIVAYANEVKVGVLGVSRETLERHGAVSREVAVEMVLGVRRLTGADFALATTGIAGPGGGTPKKPVGTVWVATATAIKSVDGKVSEVAAAQKFQFTGTRGENMESAVGAAIEMLGAAIDTLEARRKS